MDTKPGFMGGLRDLFSKTVEKQAYLGAFGTAIGGVGTVFNLASGNVLGLASDVLFTAGFAGFWKGDLQDSRRDYAKWHGIGCALVTPSFLISAMSSTTTFGLVLNLGIAAASAYGAYFGYNKVREEDEKAVAKPSAPAPDIKP